MALALTPMTALCGFRPFEEIVENLKSVPELRETLGSEVCMRFMNRMTSEVSGDEKKLLLKDFFHKLITVDKELAREKLICLVNRLQGSDSFLDRVVLDVHKDFPGDSGIFSIYLMNLYYLQPGQAIFLAQNEPHAYLKGSCVECMARSDNVVRAGLTPKLIDVPTLVNMLTYIAGRPKIYEGDLLPGVPYCKFYNPPVSEFSILSYDLEEKQSIGIDSVGPSVLLVTSGSGVVTDHVITYPFGEGASFLIYAGTKVTVTADGGRLQLFQATTGTSP
eukprot:TRINITY_DN2927_c0_g1_i24.p1 TRINITY_DN2927_c0_g1~~TRINITY_DN2927_c0_g1_i24.p1  ORF type:complete len:277 (-),score=53.32 TRINITY_DN2927_c0_g1_i24:260-1090(-)